MNKEQMIKYGYELMIKNNPDEAVKNLILKDKLQQRIDKAIKHIKKKIPYWEEWHYDMVIDTNDMNEIIKILKGEDK